MSRYTVPTDSGYACYVGWDPPLGTFYAQVFQMDDRKGTDVLIFWVGTELHEIVTVGGLEVHLERMPGLRIVLPEEIVQQLEHEAASLGFRPNLGTVVLMQLRRKDER